MATRSKFSETQLIAFWLEDTAIDDIAQRERISRRSLVARWRKLQRLDLLPFERQGEPIEAEIEVDPPRHSIAGPPVKDDDGRSSVSSLWGDDLLLEELFEVHHAQPGTVDYVAALDLPVEKYRESPRYRAQQKQQKQQHR